MGGNWPLWWGRKLRKMEEGSQKVWRGGLSPDAKAKWNLASVQAQMED